MMLPDGWGGYEQYNTAMEALGYNSRSIYERADFNKAVESGMMTQRIADEANKYYGTNMFSEGMKTNLVKSVSKDGKLNITDASMTTNTGTERWTGSGWVKEDKLNKGQALKRAEELKEKGFDIGGREACQISGFFA